MWDVGVGKSVRAVHPTPGTAGELSRRFAPDYRNETPAHPERGFTGVEQVRKNWQQIFAMIPDVRRRAFRAAPPARPRMSRHNRETTVVSHPRRLLTSLGSDRFSRNHASCTASSASLWDPSIR